MHVACVSPSFVLFAYVGENLVFLRNHHISLKSLMFSLNFLFIALYFHAEYSPGHGRLPDLSKMEAKFLRLSTDLKLSTTQADAVSRCTRNGVLERRSKGDAFLMAMLPSSELGASGRLQALQQIVEHSELGPLVQVTYFSLLIHIYVHCFDSKARLCGFASLRALKRRVS